MWLQRNGYTLDTLDCSRELTQVMADLHHLLRWEEQFGYTPDPAQTNMNALRDAFRHWRGFRVGAPLPSTSDLPERHVLELVRADLAWQKDPDWMRGLLSILQERSRWQLALGRRFFALLVVAERSAMIRAHLDEERVPVPFWNPNRGYHNFER